MLRRVWKQYYEVVAGQAKWRAGPQAEEGEGVIRSPYDPLAQTGKKRETVWLGYKVHLTETCSESSETTTPNLIVQVRTTVAPVPDGEMTAAIQAALERAHLKPDEHLVDTGSVDAEQLASSRERDIRLMGPTMPDSSWQAKAGRGLDLAHFSIDWDKRQATCPQGQTSTRFSQAGARVEIVFATQVCAPCPVRQDCTRSRTTGRVLHLRPQAAHEALQQQREVEQTPEFRQTYALRAGIESTFSQGVRALGLRRSRYDGLVRTHVQQLLTAVALNLVRIDAVLTHTARGTTRRSHFAQLATHPSMRKRALA